MQGCKGWDALDHEVQSPATAGSGYVTASESDCSVRKRRPEQCYGAANGRHSAFQMLRCATCSKTWLEKYSWVYDEERQYGAKYKEQIEQKCGIGLE